MARKKRTDDMPEFMIWIIKRTLSDGSEVFAAEVGDETFEAITEEDACLLAEAIAEAINSHTTGTAGVMYP